MSDTTPHIVVDGNAEARTILRELATAIKTVDTPPHLTIVTCAPNRATQQYLARKKERASEVGIEVALLEFPASVTTQELIASIHARVPHTKGIVVQLPLPEHIDTDVVLQAIPPSHDIDALNHDTTTVYSPVVAAIDYIATKHSITIDNSHVVVVGNGRLVGQPATRWARERGAIVDVITKEDADGLERIKSADVLILGAGQAGLITPDMVREGVVIFDAGASEVGGRLAGDADPRCSEVATLCTPVPGGIGPLTIAFLLHNLYTLAQRQTE